jgi:hypothetical protein
MTTPDRRTLFGLSAAALFIGLRPSAAPAQGAGHDACRGPADRLLGDPRLAVADSSNAAGGADVRRVRAASSSGPGR